MVVTSWSTPNNFFGGCRRWGSPAATAPHQPTLACAPVSRRESKQVLYRWERMSFGEKKKEGRVVGWSASPPGPIRSRGGSSAAASRDVQQQAELKLCWGTLQQASSSTPFASFILGHGTVHPQVVERCHLNNLQKNWNYSFVSSKVQAIALFLHHQSIWWLHYFDRWFLCPVGETKTASMRAGNRFTAY